MSTKKLKRNGEIHLVPVNEILIDENKNNTRQDYGDIEGLAKSIESNGLRNPILVKKTFGKDEYLLVHGHRRMRAINHLIKNGIEFPKIRAIIVSKDYNMDNVLLDMLTLNDGKPLTNYEQGLVFVQLMERGFSEKEVSEKAGKSLAFVRNGIEMAKLPKPIQNKIADNSISGLTAVEIYKTVNNEDEALDKIDEAIKMAETENGGKKKKATARHAKVGMTPFKTLEKLIELFNTMDENSDEIKAVKRAIKMAKMKETPESIFETFVNHS